MSIDMQVALVSYGFVALIVLVGSAVILEEDRNARSNRRYKPMSDQTRIWIGRAGLACLLWPIMAVVFVGYVVYGMFSTLFEAARRGR